MGAKPVVVAPRPFASVLSVSMAAVWTVRPPYHWRSDGVPAQAFEVRLGTEEGAAILNYFLEFTPEGTEIERLER